MRDNISDAGRVDHITECIDEITQAIAGKTFETFSADHVLRIAVVKWLEIIGEAANHITEETKNKNSDVDWQRIVALRNLVVHEYFRVDYRIIWDIATNMLKQLKTSIDKIEIVN